jgi:hypothetical protein
MFWKNIYNNQLMLICEHVGRNMRDSHILEQEAIVAFKSFAYKRKFGN